MQELAMLHTLFASDLRENHHFFSHTIIKQQNSINTKQENMYINAIINYQKKLKQETGINLITFTEISATSLDVSTIGFCTFSVEKFIEQSQTYSY